MLSKSERQKICNHIYLVLDVFLPPSAYHMHVVEKSKEQQNSVPIFIVIIQSLI